MINGYVLAAAVVFQLLFGYWAMIPVSNSCPFFGAKFLSFLFYIPMLFHPVSALLIFPIDFLLTYVLRQRPGARYPFNDLKNKKKYRAFYEQYKEVYNRVRRPAVLHECPPVGRPTAATLSTAVPGAATGGSRRRASRSNLSRHLGRVAPR